MTDEKKLRANGLAREVLILSRNTLLVNLRFLDMALSRFTMIPCPVSGLATDGERLLYHPMYVLQSYKVEKEIPVRDYLHIVLHCVYQHLFVNPTMEHTLWDLSCDIAVETIISELGLTAASASREQLQKAEIGKLKKNVKYMTAEKLYYYFRNMELAPAAVEKLRALFYADNHEIWYMTGEEKSEKYGISSGNGSRQDNDSGNDGKGDKNDPNHQKNGFGSGGELDDDSNSQNNGNAYVRSVLASSWKDIAERMQEDLETFSKQQGDRAGSMMQNLAEVNREKYDYTAFLKKFAVMGEHMQINDDEFDYIFYTYGLKLYKKVPLIEPLEYKEVKRIREFVIAIDTSGSVEGELVQTFLQKTYNIMKSTESFFSKINVHIIQCDAEIQEHVKITSEEEFDNYIKIMTIRGLGGTDFRPVFSFVDRLIAEKEFSNLKGLIYFTDGYGDFPERMPAYQTAFVFVEDGYVPPEVPSWAIRLLLNNSEI